MLGQRTRHCNNTNWSLRPSPIGTKKQGGMVMIKFKLPNGLTAQILRVNKRNGRKECWPQEVLCYADSYVVKVNVEDYSVGLVFSECCLYEYLEDEETRWRFLPPGEKAVKELMMKYFKPAAGFANCLVYSGVAYSAKDVVGRALKTAVLTGVP